VIYRACDSIEAVSAASTGGPAYTENPGCTQEIEKNIPIPSVYKYPFDQMGIGDSFFVEGLNRARLYRNDFVYGKKHNKKFLVRSADQGARCRCVE